jgi:predicted nucleic acid-binding protein
MKGYLLDTSAILTLRDDEPGADKVAELLKQAQVANTRCLGCFITPMEVLYRVWRDEGETAGRLAYEQCLALPIEWIHETTDLLKRAAAIKAAYLLSVGDAWIAACALQEDAVLIHKDPEFQAVAVMQEPLPFK